MTDLETGEVLARVEGVRVQEPTWAYAGGCAVRFFAMDDESEAVLTAAIEAAGRAAQPPPSLRWGHERS